MTAEQVIAKYIELRNQRTLLTKKHEEELAPTVAAMQKIELWLLAKLNEAGANSLNTNAGTAFKVLHTSVTMADPQVFKRFVLGPAAEAFGIDVGSFIDLVKWDVVDFRAGKKGIQEFMEQHDSVPPGVNVSQNTGISVRRA